MPDRRQGADGAVNCGSAKDRRARTRRTRATFVTALVCCDVHYAIDCAVKMRDGGDGMNLDKSSIGAHEVCVGRGSSMCNSKVVSFCCLLVLSAGSVSAQ